MRNPADDWEDEFINEMELLTSCGDHMTLEKWKKAVRNGSLNDHGGDGQLATANKRSDIDIRPSQLATFKFPEWCTHIVWYQHPF